MNFALCGQPSLARRVQESLRNSDIEFKFFLNDRATGENDPVINLPTINFFEFRWLVNAGELDGVIIADREVNNFTKDLVQKCKLYEIPKVGVANPVNYNPFNPVYMLEPSKIYLGYLETNLIDGCNLNCRGCTHFAKLFSHDEIYPLENFRRDVGKLSQICDIVRFRLLGGEPLLLKNLDEYIKITRQYFPKTNLRLVTNGLLIPSLPQKILDSIRENNCILDISPYQPTVKIADKIKDILKANRIVARFDDCAISKFVVFLTLHSGNNPEKARTKCLDDVCRFLRNGKIYKCPPDALSYRFAEKFGIENFPAATGIDINAPNFSLLLRMLDGNVEMCSWCSDKERWEPWEVSNKPVLEEWLADPSEIKNFL